MRFFAPLCVALACGCGQLLLSPPKPPGTKPVLSPAEQWNRMLSRVDAQGRVDYEAFRKSPGDLDAVVDYVATFSPDSDPDRFPTSASRLAYTINAYNALVIYAIVDSDGRPAPEGGFYRRTEMMVGGHLKTLAELQSALRPFRDSRAYFALCGGANGHPKLSPVAYEPRPLEAQLDQAARRFINDPKNVHVDRERRTVSLSEFFQWHGKDFAQGAPFLLAYLNRFREDKLPETYKVAYRPLDWTLNASGGP